MPGEKLVADTSASPGDINPRASARVASALNVSLAPQSSSRNAFRYPLLQGSLVTEPGVVRGISNFAFREQQVSFTIEQKGSTAFQMHGADILPACFDIASLHAGGSSTAMSLKQLKLLEPVTTNLRLFAYSEKQAFEKASARFVAEGAQLQLFAELKQPDSDRPIYVRGLKDKSCAAPVTVVSSDEIDHRTFRGDKQISQLEELSYEHTCLSFVTSDASSKSHEPALLHLFHLDLATDFLYWVMTSPVSEQHFLGLQGTTQRRSEQAKHNGLVELYLGKVVYENSVPAEFFNTKLFKLAASCDYRDAGIFPSTGPGRPDIRSMPFTVTATPAKRPDMCVKAKFWMAAVGPTPC